MITDPDAVQPYLEDAAHFRGGFAAGVYRPKNEKEVAEIVGRHQASGAPLLAQGARSSLTGGATPFGEAVLSLENLNRILRLEKTGDGEGRAVLQPFVRLAELQQEAGKLGLFYPPVPTYDLATIGGTVATCAAGSATFKYGTTRDWVARLKVVLSDGDLLDVRRGACLADAEGFFETQTVSGKKIRFSHPTSYRTPTKLKKVSCGYFAAPKMDLLDLFIGSEGTLGVVTEVEVRLTRKPAAVLSGLAFFDSEEKAFEFVGRGRELAQLCWKRKEREGLDFRAMEFLDDVCLKLLQSEGMNFALRIPLPQARRAAIYFEMELSKETANSDVMDRLERYLEESAGGRGENRQQEGVEKLFQLLQQFGALNPEELVLALPQDQEMLANLRQIREAVPELINEQIGRRKQKVPELTKVAADTVVPFERVPEMVKAFRQAARNRSLTVAIFGHISDGNLHPNILVQTAEQVKSGRQAILEAMKQVLELGGAPMAEHGVGRNALKQELLELFYGAQGVREMARLKRALDPRAIFSPGVIFSQELLDEADLSDAPEPSIREGAATQGIGDEEGRLWRFSLKTLTKAQHFVNGFLSRFLVHNASAQELMGRLRQIGKKTSGYLTDYVAVPYSPALVRELKRLGFARDPEAYQFVFRHPEGIFPPFIVRCPRGKAINMEVMDEKVPVLYEYDEEDIWVPLTEVWRHLPLLEENFEEVAQQPFPFLADEEIPQMEVGWRVGELSRFGFADEEIEGGPLYRRAAVPKENPQEPQLVLVERKIGIYSGFETAEKAPKLPVSFQWFYTAAKNFYAFGHKPFIFLFGMERLVGLLILLLGPKWARRLLNETHDAQWFRNNPKGKKDFENAEALLGKGGWEIFVDHRTLRRSLLPHLSLLDRLLKLVGLAPRKPMGQNEVCFRILTRLGTEKHEEYTPTNVSDWKARVLRDRDLARRKVRSQLAYFLDESLPGKRGNIATFAAFWGATTGWAPLDFALAFLRFDWGPDPWTFHHIAIEGDFDSLAKAVQLPGEGQTFVTPDQKIENSNEVGFLDRFSFMWFLRQVFSKEVRLVPEMRARALYLAGRLTREEYARYTEAGQNGAVKVEGPHLEIIDRRSGIPWFNQVRVTQAIETSSEVRVESSNQTPLLTQETWQQRLKNLFPK